MSPDHRRIAAPIAVAASLFWLVLCLATPFSNEATRVSLLYGGFVAISMVLLQRGYTAILPLAKRHRPPPPKAVITGDARMASPHAELASGELEDGGEADEVFAEPVAPALSAHRESWQTNRPASSVQPLGNPQRPPSMAPVRLATGITAGFSDWALLWRVGALEGTLPLPRQISKIKVGRTPDNHVIVDLDQVSSKHLRLQLPQGGQGGFVVDVGSSNGTAMLEGDDGKIMNSGELHPWPDGASIVIPNHPPEVVRLRLQRLTRTT